MRAGDHVRLRPLGRVPKQCVGPEIYLPLYLLRALFTDVLSVGAAYPGWMALSSRCNTVGEAGFTR
jgi:hypothetical protein